MTKPMTVEELRALANILRDQATRLGCTAVIISVATPDKHYVSYSGQTQGEQWLAEKALEYVL